MPGPQDPNANVSGGAPWEAGSAGGLGPYLQQMQSAWKFSQMMKMLQGMGQPSGAGASQFVPQSVGAGASQFMSQGGGPSPGQQLVLPGPTGAPLPPVPAPTPFVKSTVAPLLPKPTVFARSTERRREPPHDPGR